MIPKYIKVDGYDCPGCAIKWGTTECVGTCHRCICDDGHMVPNPEYKTAAQRVRELAHSVAAQLDGGTFCAVDYDDVLKLADELEQEGL
jgi:hypothetical protein